MHGRAERASGSPACGASCRRSSTGSTSDGARGRGGASRSASPCSLLPPNAAARRSRSSGSASCRGPAAMVDFGSDGRIGAKWNAATRTIAYGRPQQGRPLPRLHRRRRRRPTSGASRSPRGATIAISFPAAWHPGGELLAMLVEQNEHERSSVDAIPGYGAYTDYWIVTPRRQRARGRSTRLPDGYDHAITHAAFSPDGSKFVWTERVKAPRLWDLNLFAGGYVFKVADFVAAPRAAPRERAHASSPATSTRAARSSRSPPTTGRSPSTAPTSRRTCSRRASTRWTSRAA